MKSFTIGLVGNPNAGKTTLFNALTGSHQKVGNWPGVTVERKSGQFIENNYSIEVIDLPGTYSLTAISPTQSIDERIACEYILNGEANLIVNIVDACHLERHLYLTLQLLEMHVPVVVVVNMLDIAENRKIHIDIDELSKQLNCPVIGMISHKRKGLRALKSCLVETYQQNNIPQSSVEYPSIILEAKEKLSMLSHEVAIHLLENDIVVQKRVPSHVVVAAQQIRKDIETMMGEESDIIIADARYSCAHRINQTVMTKGQLANKTWTDRLDNIVLHRLWGIPIFLGIMYFMFFFAINVSGILQDFFDITSDVIFVQGFAYYLQQWHAPAWVVAVLASGLGKGINTVVSFVPVIGGLFLFLSFLESSGYMSRAAFVVDRFMQAIGLPGKSFVPMIVGFGCNVPAVMAARTLDNPRDRLLTIMMSPFMSCGARLAIYAVFIAAFFPTCGATIVFALYLIGIVMGIITGFILRKTRLQGKSSPLIMELPPYHLPTWSSLWLQTWQRLKGFIFRAGKLIVPICLLLGVLNMLSIHGTLIAPSSDGSLLAAIGKTVTPLFTPMGIDPDNWPASVGLLAGILAKEVVVGTLNTLYMQASHLTVAATSFDLWNGLKEAFLSIPNNIVSLSSSLSNPIASSAPDQVISQRVLGVMYQYFGSQTAAFAYLLFVLLYFPCVSTIAVMWREINWKWTLFSVLWTTLVAYGLATLFYQMSTILIHPLSSLVWVSSILVIFTFILSNMSVEK